MDHQAQQGGNSQILIFILDGGQYGVDILKVQEIRDRVRPTPIPSAPDFFKGVTDLRGEFVPVIDLRVKLGIPVENEQANNVTIILRADDHLSGIVVDAVSEVLTISSGDVKPMPATRYTANVEFVHGLVTHAGSTVVLLDMDNLLSADELDIQAGIAQAQKLAAVH
jgi:purine-binding chemotaxis protein CheW